MNSSSSGKWRPLAEWALTEADRMTILAANARASHFFELQRYLLAQASGARAWANEQYRRNQ